LIWIIRKALEKSQDDGGKDYENSGRRRTKNPKEHTGYKEDHRDRMMRALTSVCMRASKLLGIT